MTSRRGQVGGPFGRKEDLSRIAGRVPSAFTEDGAATEWIQSSTVFCVGWPLKMGPNPAIYHASIASTLGETKGRTIQELLRPLPLPNGQKPSYPSNR